MTRFSIFILVTSLSLVSEVVSSTVIETEHFHIVSDYEITHAEALRICQTAEAAYQAVQSLPIKLTSDPATRYSINLLDEPIHMHHSSGARTAAGIFLPESNEAIVHFSSSGGSAIDHQTLIHEITHQMHQDWLQTLPVWLSEGLAVYMASHPSSPAVTDLANSPQLARFHDQRIHIIQLEHLLNLNRENWNQLFEDDPNGVDRFYLTAYLLTYYLLHMSENKSLQLPNEAADTMDATTINQQLLNSRSPAQLEADLIEAFMTEQIRLIPMLGYFDSKDAS